MIGAIIQARLDSSRLPRKVLLPMPKDGKISVLAQIAYTALRAETINKTIIVTPDKEIKDRYEHYWCGETFVSLWTQSYRDPLGEFYLAATIHGLDTIVRISADCPLLTSEEIDRVITAHILQGNDYTYNHHDSVGIKGDGMDVEVFTFRALRYAHFTAIEPSDREHVTLLIRRSADRFKIGYIPVPDCETLSLNTMEDYDKICEIWQRRHEIEKEKETMT